MASRVMHLVIAKLIAEQITFNDINLFMIGNFSPDFSKYNDSNYEQSHFGDSTDIAKGIDYVKYANAYCDGGLDDFRIGYFVHLLTDAIWLKHIQQVYVRSFPNRKHELYKFGYSDMNKYNPILINLFELDKPEIYNICLDDLEFEYGTYLEFMTDLKNDFSVEYVDDKFQVYPYDKVLGFIDLTVSEAINMIIKLRKYEYLDDSSKYYVPI